MFGWLKSTLAALWRAVRLLLTLAMLALMAGLSTCSPHLPLLRRIQLEGVLHVATTNSPTTCYQGADGPAGFECELLQRMAHSLHLQLKLHFYGNAPAVLNAVINGDADVGAAGLIIDSVEAQRVHFTTPLRKVTQELVYRMGQPRPRSLDALKGTLQVVEASAAEAALAQHLTQYPGLSWQTTRKFGSEDLLYRVQQGTLDYTVANSDLIAINQRYYPDLRAAFPLSAPQPIAWALRRGPDASLYTAVQGFLDALGTDGIQRLHDQYFNSSETLDYLGVVRFSSDCETLLPKYKTDFQQAAKANGIDWRLLAAIGYQESHWNPDAVSFTGVRGLMMLTTDTAAQFDVKDRQSPRQSIFGAARFFSQLLQQLPASIRQPDRVWMALAAYNMGMGHLEDARVLAQKRGGNPDLWKDVEPVLPLLMQEQWFSQTHYGYARGGEAKVFVDNVRSYYDILTWFTGGQPALIQRNPSLPVDDATKS